MKIVTIIGARPQFIKAAVISRALKLRSEITEVIIHTGQHFDHNMSEIFFQEMEIPKPNYNLNINGLGHGAMTGNMLVEIESILLKENPDYVLVYGDTNSTLAGALAGKKLHIKVIHIEAGLRSHNMLMPEEINRILTDRISDLLFCPSKESYDNLFNEGYTNFNVKIRISGDVMLDAVQYYNRKALEKSTIVEDLNLDNFVLCTIHREESTSVTDNISSIVNSLNLINEEIQVVVPVHPRTSKIIHQLNLRTNFTTIDPVGYFDMIRLIGTSKLVLTDSGGLQKEAYFLEKNCVTLRQETEWTELVTNGYNICSGYDKGKIIECFKTMMNRKNTFDTHFYGMGNAGELIVQNI